VKADYITINGVEEPIVDINISYMDALKGYPAFRLNGINRLAVLMFEPLAVMEIPSTKLNWIGITNSLSQRTREEMVLLKRRALMSCSIR
jgi:hypothetical protein